jgi:tetratricopeptide (TPR) repeat protein
MKTRSFEWLLAAALAVAGCHSKSTSSNATAGAPSAHESSAEGPRPAPLSQAKLPTTDGSIAMGNFDAQIAAIEDGLRLGPADVEARASLAGMLSTRAKYRGHIADLERSVQIAEDLWKDAPASATAWLARASARAAMHRFEEALADAAEAERRGARPRRIDALRASIFQALGRYDEALTLRRAAAEARPDIDALGIEAALLAEMGRTREALPLFEKAAATYRNVSPLPVAWLYLQEGLALERDGDDAGATAFFRAAHERLPAFMHAALHLALHVPRDEALALLRPLAKDADDPELLAALSTLERDGGDVTRADALRDRARARYDELCAAHPEAYSDHAGWFWLDVGGDAKKALDYGRRNLAMRKTDRAYELVLLSALRVGDTAAACEVAVPASRYPYATEMLRSVATSTAARCR